MKRLLIGVLVGAAVLGALAGCFSFTQGRGPVDGFQFLASRNPGLDQNVTGVLHEQADPVEIVAVVPPSADSLNLAATFSLNTEAVISVVSSGRPVVQQNGVTRNDFSSPVLYSVQVPNQKRLWRYRVTVRYAETNAALSQISIPEGFTMTPLFSPRVKSYTVDVPFSVTRVRIEAKAQSATLRNISIDGSGSGGASASTTVDFSSGASRRVSVETLAEDGATRDVYTVLLKRLPADSNARLESLELVDLALFPAFSPTRASYQAEVPFDATQVIVRAKAQSRAATITLQTLAVVGRITSGRTALAARGSPTDRAGAVIDFSSGTLLPVIVAVTAEDGGVQEYLVEVRRAEPDHNNALAELAVPGNRISPAFSPRTLAYTVQVPYSARQLVIAAKAQSPYATVELVKGTGTPALSARGELDSRDGMTVDLPTAERIVLAVAVTAQDGRTAQYVLDVRRAPPDGNADLGALAVSSGVLSPIFSPRIISYAVSLASGIASTRITASTASEVATVAVEGSAGRPSASQTFTVAVAAGATETVNLIVTAEDGTQKMYRIRVSREAAIDTNTRLARLQLAGALLTPDFHPNVFEYQAQLASNVPSVTLTALAENPAATIVVDGQVLARTGRVIALDPGPSKTVVIDVTAASGSVARTFLRLNREWSGQGRDTNTRLARLQLAGAQINPGFDPRVLDYEARLASNVPSVTLTATAESPVAAIEVDGQPLGRTGRVIALDPGTSKTVVIDVTAQSGDVARTILWLSRERSGQGRDTNTRLARLQLAGAQLNPNFDPRVLDYQAQLAANVPSVTLTATAESSVATIEVDGQPLGRTGRTIALDPGTSRTAVIDVTAESGNVSRTVLRLSREAARDTNARLSRLQLVGAQLNPNFDPRVLDYQAQLAANVPSVTLTATTESPVATIEVDGQPLGRTGRTIALDPGTSKTVVIDVTAQSGNVSRTVLRLSREAARDTNARLSRLQLVGAQLNPNFDPRVLDYQARLEANVDAVTLNAAAESPVATIAVDGQPLGRTGRTIALDPGTSRTVVIDVTAQSGNVSRTVLRLSREAARDTNARLSRLQLVGAQLNPNFDPRVLDYQARLESNVDAVTLTAAAESPVATIAVDGQPLGRTGRTITLDPGTSKTVVIDVTAQSGNVSRTVLRLSREAGGGPTPPPGQPGGQRVSVTLDGVKIAERELRAMSAGRGSVGSEARITVRQYRTNTVIAQGTAPVSTRMQGAAPVLSAQWRSPGVRLDPGRLVEIEVAIPAGGSNWLHYTEAQWADGAVEVDVPFLLLSDNPRVAWPAAGRPVFVTGCILFSPRGPQKTERQPDAESFDLDARGQYGVEVTVIDPRTGATLGSATVWGKPGLPRGHVFTFPEPMRLPEGATVKYTVTAKAKNGQAWTATGSAQIWTTNLAYESGFAPVVLVLEETLAPPR